MRKFLPSLLIAIGFVIAAHAGAVVIAAFGSSLYDDWRLVFQQLQSGGRFWGLAVVCAVAVGCIATLFRYEQQLISRQLGVTLLTLRLLLVLVLLFTLLEPVWTWSYDEETSGRVLIALDSSESMDTRDTHATPAEKIRWAKATGMVGNRGVIERMDRWLIALEQGTEPEWVTEREEPDPMRRARTAQARRENFHELLADVDKLSRLDLASRALTTEPNSLVEKLNTEATTELALFAGDFASIDRGSLQRIINGEEVALDRKRSDLLQPLQAALASPDETRLAGLVILSDGRDTSGTSQPQFLSRIGGLGVPVHTVLVGSELRPRDLSVSHLDHPESVFKDDAASVKAVIHTAGFEGEEVAVYLDWLDEPDKAPLSETVTPSGPAAEVSFALNQLDVGRHRFRVRMDVAENETRDDNNSRDFSISVVDDRAQVLLIEGAGRWEFRFLDNALERDERVAVEQILFEQPYLGVLPRTFFPGSFAELNLDMNSNAPFAKYDVIILGDVSPRDLPLPQWRLLEKYVRDDGGTLVLTAGKRFVPMAYAGTVVDALLPIEKMRTIDLDDRSQTGPPPRRGFHLSVTPDGERLAMFQLAADAAEARRIWSELPGHHWGIVGQAKGGASVWAAALRPGERPSLELERENGLIAQHYVGTGQVIWIGIDSTWRWRYRVGDSYHHRFWGQLVRAAVSFKASAGNQFVRLGLRETVVQEGDAAVIQARWDERFLMRNPQLRGRVVVESLNDARPFSQRIDLAPKDGSAAVHEAQAPNLKPGEYRVRVEVDGVDLGADSPEVLLMVQEQMSPELRDISANRAFLEAIASTTGGEFLLLDELQRLPELLRQIRQTTSIREEIPLWSHWLILILFCGLAMTEWVLRKLNGLP